MNANTIDFKYRPVDANGNETGFFSSKGSLSDTELVLDKSVIPLVSIYQVIHRYSRLVIVYQTDTGPVNYVIAPHGGMDQKLKQGLDRRCSYHWAETRREQLEREGQGIAFRTMRCEACQAIIDLTGFAPTPQLYCPFCESILPADDQSELLDLAYRLCDRCRFYSKPIRFTASYLVLNVVSWKEHDCCHVCMRRETWKMLAVNLLPPFIGFAVALVQAFRAYSAGYMDSYLPELVRANAYGTKGRVEQAEPLYEAMLERVGPHAGLRYNLALTHANAGDWRSCLKLSQEALRDCANYGPAANLVIQALTNLHRRDEAEHFAKSWGAVTPLPIDEPPDNDQGIRRRDSSRGDDGIRDRRG